MEVFVLKMQIILSLLAMHMVMAGMVIHSYYLMQTAILYSHLLVLILH